MHTITKMISDAGIPSPNPSPNDRLDTSTPPLTGVAVDNKIIRYLQIWYYCDCLLFYFFVF